MQRHQPEVRLGGEELPEVARPHHSAQAGAGERHVRQGPGEPGEVARERSLVVALGAAEDPVTARAVPRERGVQVRLVAELERPHRLRADPVDQRARLGGRQLRAVLLEVDSEDQMGAERLRERAGHREPLMGDVERDAGRPIHAGHRPPGPVRAVAADPQDRRLPRREVAHELLEHRVERGRIGAGVGLERGVLDRQTQEAPGHQRVARAGVDRDRRRVPGRAVGVAAARARQREPDDQHGHDRHDDDVECEEAAAAPGVHNWSFARGDVGNWSRACNTIANPSTARGFRHGSLLDDRRSGGRHVAAVASAGRGLRAARHPRAVPLRPLSQPRRAASRAGRARCVGHDQRARGADEHAPPRHARLAGELPPPVGARQARGHRRPRISRSDRARHRRRLARARARGLRISVRADRGAHGRARGAATGADRALGQRAVLARRRALRPVRPRRADPSPSSSPTRR